MESLIIALIFGLYGYGYMKSAIAIFISSLLLGSAQLNCTTLFFLYNALIYYYYGSYGVAIALTISCIYISIGLMFLLDIRLSSIKYAIDPLYKKSRFIELMTSNISLYYIYTCSLFDTLLIAVGQYMYRFKQLTQNIKGIVHIYKAYDRVAFLINGLCVISSTIKSLYGLSRIFNSHTDDRATTQTLQPSVVQQIEPSIYGTNRNSNQATTQTLQPSVDQQIEPSICSTNRNSNKATTQTLQPSVDQQIEPSICGTNRNSNQAIDCSDSDSLDECDDIQHTHVDRNDQQNMNLIGNFELPDINQIIEMESKLTDEQKKQRDVMAEKMMNSFFGKNTSGIDFEKMFSMFDMTMNLKNA